MKAFFIFSLLFLLCLAAPPRSLSTIRKLDGLDFYQNLTVNASLVNYSSIQASLYLQDSEYYITGDNCGNLSFWNLTAGNLSFQYQLPLTGLNATNASNLTFLCSLSNRSISKIISLENRGKIAFSVDNTLYFFDIQSQNAFALSHQAKIGDITYLRKRDWVASGDVNGIINIWSTNGIFIKRSWVPYAIQTLESEYDSNFLMVGGWSNYLNVINIESGRIMKTFGINGYLTNIQDMRYTELMALAFSDNTLIIVNKHNWIRQVTLYFNQIKSISWDFHNNLLSVAQDHEITWVNVSDTSYNTLQAIQISPETILRNDLYAKGNGYTYLMVVLANKIMEFNFTTQHHPHSSNSSFVINQTLIWNMTERTQITNLIHYHNDKYQHEYLITSDDSGIINVVNISSGGIIKTYNDAWNRKINCLIQIANTSLIAYGVGREIIVWDVEINTLYRNLTVHVNNVTSLVYIPEIDRLISGSLDGFIRVWDISCCSKQSIYVSQTGVRAVDYIEGTSSLLVLSYNDPNVQVWNMTSGTIIKCWDGGQTTQLDLISIPNTPYFMTAGADNTTALRSKTSFDTLRIFGFDQPIGGFSYDSTMNLLLVTAGNSLNILDLDDFNMSTIYREVSPTLDGLFFYPYILQGSYYDYQNVSYSVLIDATANYLQAWNLTISWGNATDPNQTNTTSLLKLIGTSQKEKDQGFILSYAYSASKQYVLTGDNKGYLRLFNATGGNTIRTFKSDSDQVQVVQVLDPDTLVAFTEKNKIKIFDINSFTVQATLSDHLDNVTSLAYNPSTRQLISGSLDGTVRVWGIDNQAVTTTIYAFQSGISQVVYNRYNNMLVCSGVSESVIQVFRLTGEKVYEFNHNVQAVTTMVDLDSRFIAYIGINGLVYFFDVYSDTPYKALEFPNTPNSLTYDGFHNTLVVSTSNQIFIYNLTDRTVSNVLNESLTWTFIASSFEYVQETPYRFDTILMEETDRCVKIWNVTYPDIKTFTPNGSNYYIDYFKSFQLKYAADMLLHLDDGDKMVAGDRKQGVLVTFQPSSGNQNTTVLPNRPIANLNLASSNGDYIAVSSYSTVYIVNTVNNTINTTFQCGNNQINALTYDSESSRLLIGDSYGRVYFWDTKNQTCLYNITFQAHFTGGVNSLQYLGNKELLSSGVSDNTVKLWTLENNTMLNSFVGPRAALPINLLGAADDNSAVINYLPRSEYMVAGGYGAVYVWNRQNSTIMKSFLMNETVTSLQSYNDKDTMVVSTSNSIYFVNAHDFNISLVTTSYNNSQVGAFLSYKNSSTGDNYLMLANSKGAVGIYQVVNYNGDQSLNERGGGEESSDKAWIAGVVIGCLAAVVIIGICIACIVKRHRKKKEDYGGYKHFNDSKATDNTTQVKPAETNA